MLRSNQPFFSDKKITKMQFNIYSKHTLALLMAAALTCGACNKFLDLKPVSAITTDNAYSSADNIEAALTGAYSTFMGSNYYQWENICHSDVRSDNAYCGGSNDIDYYQLDLNNIPNTNGSAYRAWTELYAGIAKANAVLNNIDQVTDPKLTETRKAQIIGEASFLRAYHYFQLVTLFGGVPLEKHSNSADPKVINLAKATEKETYDFIAADLQVAVSNLPYLFGSANVDKVRATRGAAFAMLAKAWAQRSDRDYQKVAAYCDSVILGGGNYSLLPDFNSLFDGAHNYNAESIMEVAFIANTPQANWGEELLYPTHDDNGQVPSDTWQRYAVPSRTLVKAFDDAGDTKRKNATISFETAPWSDDYWNPCADAGTPIPFAYKHRNPNNWSGGDHNYLLRLADILLLKAEALANLGKTSEALPYLNEVRHRAGLPDVTTTDAATLKTIILRERQLELAFEGQRWNDLNRYGLAVSTMNNLQEAYFNCENGTPGAPVSVKYNFNDNKTILPMPLLELQANPNLKQNEGY